MNVVVCILLFLGLKSHCVSGATVLECTIGPDGTEVCGEEELEEGGSEAKGGDPQDSQEGKSDVWTDISSENDENVLFWEGGTLVNSKIECLDRIENCHDIIDSDPNVCKVGENVDILDAIDLLDQLVQTSSRCKVSCGICEKKEGKTTNIKMKQRNDGTMEEQAKVQSVIFESVRYLHVTVLVDDGFKDMYQLCQDDNELCAFWASMEECNQNPSFMEESCMLSCNTCDKHTMYVQSDPS